MNAVTVSYGRARLTVPGSVSVDAVYAPRAIAPAADPRREVERALAEPVGAPPLGELARTARRVAVIIPDPTRGLPKELMLKAVGDALRAMADENITIVVAYGRHGREDAEDLGLPGGWERRFRVVHHDAFDAESHGRLSSPDDSELWFDLDRAVLDAEFVVGLGAVRPHYFAGFTGGAKLLMPGCASIATIRRNHALRTDRRARLGIVNGNRARENQEACAALHGRYVTLAAVTTERGELIRAAYGDAVRAHRALVPLARTLGQVDIEPVDIVVAGAAHPTSINIYQITKVVAPAAKVCAPGGVVIVCGPCPSGVGDLKTVNDVIYRHTLTRYLPEGAKCFLVSDLPTEIVGATFFEPAESLDDALFKARAHVGKSPRVAVLPDAAYMIPVAPDENPSDW